MPNVDFTKVKSITVDAPICIDSKTTNFNVVYRSGIERYRTISLADVPQFIVDAQAAGVEISGYDVTDEHCRKLGAQAEESPADPATVLANLLGLTEDQTKLLPGATRLNFWRNGCLNIQIQHGIRSIKFPCPKAPADDDLVALLFDDWKWSKLDENRLYFRPSKEARVTL